MSLLYVLVMTVGIAMSSAYYFQAVKIFRKKSVKGVSATTYLILTPGIIIWLLYGISIKDMPVIIGNALNLIGCLLVLLGYFKYNKN